MKICALFLILSISASLSGSEDQNLTQCEKFDVCNVVSYPYFGKYTVEKLCSCPGKIFCPATFSEEGDDKSISVNARTQMKFCDNITELFAELPECDEEKTSLVVNTMFNINEVANITAKMTCQCNKKPVYWKHIMRSGQPIEGNDNLFQATDHYECSELKKCETNDFCGLARTDYGFIFQRCTCSKHDQCRYYVEESEIEQEIEELFYNYSFYKSYCLRNENSEIW